MRFIKSVLIIGFITFGTTNLYAQEEIEDVLLAGQEDAQALVNGYIAPIMNGIGTGFAGGWYNTARTHKPFGIDLTVTANAAFIPDEDRFYSPEFQRLTYANGLDQSPTVAGPAGDEFIPEYRYEYTDENGNTYSGTIEGPPGLGLKEEIGFQAVPVPMVNLGIGLVKNTDLKIRWTPKIDLDGGGDAKMLGFALMHDIKQHIPGISRLPFDLSVLVGFTDLDINYQLDDFVDSQSGDATLEAANAEASYDVNSWTVQGIISKEFSVLTLYGAVGFNRIKSSINMLGTYTVSYESAAGSTTETFENPVNLEFGAGGPRMTAGFRLKLAILTLHVDYTLQKYSTLTAGVGFTFAERKNNGRR